MINDLLKAVYTRLTGDSTLEGLLSDSVITPSDPAVYTALPVPNTAELPYVVIAGPVSDTPRDTFDAEYRDVLIDIHCYAAKPDGGGGSVAAVNNIAERVWTLMHRQPLTIVGDPRNLICRVEGSTILDDESAFGRVLTLRAHMAL